jgi:hypothetical protein
VDGHGKASGKQSGKNADMAIKDIEKGMDDFLRKVDFSIMTVNQKVGGDFVGDAVKSVKETVYGRTVYDKKGNVRKRRPWELSGNLLNSIGYTNVQDGSIAEESFPGGGEGAAEGKKAAQESLKGINGHALVMAAGMNYAIYVEAKGYDVISNSVEKAKVTHQRMMNKVLAEVTKRL